MKGSQVSVVDWHGGIAFCLDVDKRADIVPIRQLHAVCAMRAILGGVFTVCAEMPSRQIARDHALRSEVYRITIMRIPNRLCRLIAESEDRRHRIIHHTEPEDGWHTVCNALPNPEDGWHRVCSLHCRAQKTGGCRGIAMILNCSYRSAWGKTAVGIRRFKIKNNLRITKLSKLVLISSLKQLILA
ncbi:hypothetical protein AVEN_56664-1 [Araneus ventricosus]|uniref:Uncharacterized protein n=1 Tax=Araneus ventricosus TaxID=182803 RepID=A0A4Y2I0J3_ARAVE|nr:hypothetical protein AVEN_56664-1 [Araneus ventricosus]